MPVLMAYFIRLTGSILSKGIDPVFKTANKSVALCNHYLFLLR